MALAGNMQTPRSLRLGASDRVLVLAPHPDDESIACGGLLLAARDAGAARAVVVMTDGDNNPWPQRWIEKRWSIDVSARARWGARRRAEAHAALDVVGVDRAERHFLGLPDSTLTALLMHGGLSDILRVQIERFRPTHVALPALHDKHPDHSAVHVAARLALSPSPSARLLAYAIHADAGHLHDASICLDERARVAKRAAILQHRTQMRLSGGRFLRFAAEFENFDAPAGRPRPTHPLRAVAGTAGIVLELDVNRLRDPPQALSVLVVCDSASGKRTRLELRLEADRGATQSRPEDLSAATVWQRLGHRLVTHLPQEEVAPESFFKLVRRRSGLVIYDRYGWQLPEPYNADLGKV